MPDILEVIGLKTYFFIDGSIVKAVDGISFNVKYGETFGLVGESGCGKSATCRSLLRLIKKPGYVIGGSVLYKGADLLALNNEEMRKVRGKEIGMIFQEPMTALNPVLKIKEQIYESFIGFDMTEAQKYERAIELLRLVGIPMPEIRINEYPHQFSGGMRQRAMIAIALAANPKLLLADEPTTALDVTIQDQILKLLNKLKEDLDMSMLLITHDLGVVAQMCDRVAVMYAGHIMEICDVGDLFSKPRNPYTYGLLSSLPSGASGMGSVGSSGGVGGSGDASGMSVVPGSPGSPGAGGVGGSGDASGMSVAPGSPGAGGGRRLAPIKGAPPDLSDLPDGCPFAPRCDFAQPDCLTDFPEMRKVECGHYSRCHHIDKMEGITWGAAVNGGGGA